MRISDWSSDVCSSDLYANRKESFGFLLTHSDAGNRTCAGRRIVRWSEKPLGFLIFRSPELSAWPLEADWLAGSAAAGEACSTMSQRLFGGEIDADEIGKASCVERVCTDVSILVGGV